MKFKKTFGVIGIFALVILALTLVSAASLSIDATKTVIPESVAHNAGTFQITFELKNTGLAAPTIEWTDSSINQDATFSSFSHNSIADDVTQTITATITFPAHKTGSITGTIVADPLTSNEKTVDFSVPILESKSLEVIVVDAISKTQNGTIKVKNTGNIPLTSIALTSDGDFNITLSKTSIPGGLGVGLESEAITVTLDKPEDLNLGDNTVTITAIAGTTTTEKDLTIKGEFCQYGEQGNDLEIKWIRDKSGLDKDWEWKPLDEITIDVKVENKGLAEEDYDITLELVLVDADGNIVDDFVEDEDDLEKDSSVDEDQTKTITFNFQISSDIKEGRNYKFYVKVYEEGAEDEACQSLIAEDSDDEVEVEIKKENHNIVIKDVETETTASCDSTMELTAKIYNIGESDQDKVKVNLYNQDLGIALFKEFEDLDAGDYETVTFTFAIPEDAEEKQYRFTISTEFDYDEDNDEYDKESEDADNYKYYLSVLGDCQVQAAPTITAILGSEAKVGEELIIKVTIANTEEATGFIIAATEYDTWATLSGIEPSILNINTGSTAQTEITFTPTQAGTQTFKVNVIHNGQTTEQEVSVNIAEKTGGMTGAFSGIGSTGLYVIAIVILILIIIIIILIVKVSSGPRAEEF